MSADSIDIIFSPLLFDFINPVRIIRTINLSIGLLVYLINKSDNVFKKIYVVTFSDDSSLKSLTRFWLHHDSQVVK